MNNGPTTKPSGSSVGVDTAALEAAVRGARILVGVTGGIAAYKTAMVVSRLAQAGATVTVAMTDAATRFVTPLTFQALSGQAVYTSQWEHIESKDPQHVSLATASSLAVVAPCSMDCLAKVATGRTDDVVTLILSAIDRSKTPVLLCPSMNSVMWSQPSTQRNVKQLRDDGFRLVGPDDGWQACRTIGTGRMSEPESILNEIASVLRLRVSSPKP
ncbi:phosphopantothenoylcysteine decarboxylase [Phycisphaerales bacterium]|nr:phosphopantothenoylcysteine decarboxylase [Phycisphaerales bacterium]